MEQLANRPLNPSYPPSKGKKKTLVLVNMIRRHLTSGQHLSYIAFRKGLRKTIESNEQNFLLCQKLFQGFSCLTTHTELLVQNKEKHKAKGELCQRDIVANDLTLISS